MGKTKHTTRDAVLEALRAAGKQGLTSLELSQQAGTLRYSPRIQELREQGHNITCETVQTKPKRVHRYKLVDNQSTSRPVQTNLLSHMQQSFVGTLPVVKSYYEVEAEL